MVSAVGGKSSLLGLRRAVGHLIVLLGGLLTAATVAGLLGSVWWPLDLAANFRPQYLALLPVLALLALGLRRSWAAAIMAGAAVVNASFVAPYLVGSVSGGGVGVPIEVVSFNVGISNPARGEVMQWLAAEDPDVVVLLESSFEWEDSARYAGLPYRFVAVVPAGRLSGVTVLARPDLDPRLVATPFAPRQAAAVEVDLDGSRMVVLGLHPPSPTSGGRAAERNRLLEESGEWAAAHTLPVLLVGDLNATPWSAAYRTMRWRGRLSDSLAGRGIQPTWPAGWGPMMIPIDHALHTAGLAVIERRTGPATESAHRPLIVTVAAAGGSAS